MNKFKLSLILILSITVVGCSSKDTIGTPSKQENYALVDVFYATDRKIEDTSNVKSYFGSARGALQYGKTQVSIPRDHRMGELESPSIWRFEFSEDPEKHVVLLEITSMGIESYFEALSSRINESSKKSAFIYIHGYNVTFEDAARRTGQMAYDLGFDGVPVFYSWPSHGSTPKYTFDEVNIKWAESNVKEFLLDFLEESDAENVFLIAHSMGNRALTRAYIDIAKTLPSLGVKIKEVILAAPDIDADVFKRDIAPALADAGRLVTLYASSQDIPLKASKVVHGGHPRAGDSGENLIIMPGIETIDATEVETSFLGHSYYADERSVLSDMFYIINQGLRANERSGLKELDDPKGKYWVFRK
jgi:esterase/lipase superfamily enzyme